VFERRTRDAKTAAELAAVLSEHWHGLCQPIGHRSGTPAGWQDAGGQTTMTTRVRRWMVAGLLGAVAPAALAAQSPPPVQGTIALEGTMTRFYGGINALVVTTLDGAEHVYHFAKGLVVHGAKASGPDALEGLQPGTTVVVHYRIEGAEESVEEIDRVAEEGLKVTEGAVVRLDRRRKEIVLRFPDGRTETLRLTDRAASETDDTINDATRVTVYYSDESGHKVAHYFKKAP